MQWQADESTRKANRAREQAANLGRTVEAERARAKQMAHKAQEAYDDAIGDLQERVDGSPGFSACLWKSLRIAVGVNPAFEAHLETLTVDLATWKVSQRTYGELCTRLGDRLGLSPEDVIGMSSDGGAQRFGDRRTLQADKT